ncbi:MAG: hypothetical protein FWD86_00465, partial [Firmicutes bacterium]|nr:hypothetical protein [Bacillota bacterium]
RVVNFGEDRTADDKARIASDLVEFGYSTIPQGPGGFVVGNRSQVVRLATVFIDEIDEHGLITTREEVDVPGSATTVVAIAEPGFTFVHWSDQPLPPIPENQTERSLVPTATRTVNNITGDIDENGNIDELNISAIFEFLKRSDISDSYPDPTPWPPTPPPPEEPPPDDRPPIDFIDGYRDFNDWVEQVVFLIMDDLANGRPVTPDQMAFLEAFLGGLR